MVKVYEKMNEIKNDIPGRKLIRNYKKWSLGQMFNFQRTAALQ